METNFKPGSRENWTDQASAYACAALLSTDFVRFQAKFDRTKISACQHVCIPPGPILNCNHVHCVLTICMRTGSCDTRYGDLVFFSAAFGEFSNLLRLC